MCLKKLSDCKPQVNKNMTLKIILRKITNQFSYYSILWKGSSGLSFHLLSWCAKRHNASHIIKAGCHNVFAHAWLCWIWEEQPKGQKQKIVLQSSMRECLKVTKVKCWLFLISTFKTETIMEIKEEETQYDI